MLEDLQDQLSIAYDGLVSQDDLGAEESEILQHLSPGWLAKMNSDAIKGVSLGTTLEEFKVAFADMKRRRERIERCLPDAAQDIAAQASRPLTTEEMLLFVSIPVEKIQADIKLLKQQGFTMEDALEELSARHRERRQAEITSYLTPTSLGLPSDNSTTTSSFSQVVDTTTTTTTTTTSTTSPLTVNANTANTGMSPQRSPKSPGGTRPVPSEVWFDENPTKRIPVSNPGSVSQSPYGSPPRRKNSCLMNPEMSPFGSPRRRKGSNPANPTIQQLPPSAGADAISSSNSTNQLPRTFSDRLEGVDSTMVGHGELRGETQVLRRMSSVTISDSVEVVTFSKSTPVSAGKSGIFGRLAGEGEENLDLIQLSMCVKKINRYEFVVVVLSGETIR